MSLYKRSRRVVSATPLSVTPSVIPSVLRRAMFHSIHIPLDSKDVACNSTDFGAQVGELGVPHHQTHP
jgi:hypothetical protein